MVVILHGGDTLASFQELKKRTAGFDELSVTRIDGATADFYQIKEALETPSFTGHRAVIVEDLSRNRSQSVVTDLKKYLAKEDLDLIIYERRELPPESPILDLGREVRHFPVPAGLNVFAWADLVGKRNIPAAIVMWEALLRSGEEEEYLYLMLVRQFRLLLLLNLGELVKVPEFVEGKLRGQLRFWSERELRLIYAKLLELDRLNKTGQAELETMMITFLVSLNLVSSSAGAKTS